MGWVKDVQVGSTGVTAPVDLVRFVDDGVSVGDSTVDGSDAGRAFTNQVGLTDTVTFTGANTGTGVMEVGTSMPPELGGQTLAGYNTLTSRLGKAPVIVHAFEPGSPPNNWKYGFLPPGVRVCVNIKGTPEEWLAGQHAANVHSMLSAAPAGTWVSYWAEASPVELPSSANYRAACTIVSQVVRSEDCMFMTAPMGFTLRGTQSYNGQLVDWRDWVSAPSEMDVFAFDNYAKAGPVGNTAWDLVKDGVNAAAEWGNLPWAILELGIGVTNGTPIERAQLMTDILTYGRDHNCAGFLYWPGNDAYRPPPGDPLWAALGAF